MPLYRLDLLGGTLNTGLLLLIILFLSCEKYSHEPEPEPQNSPPVITSNPVTQINENQAYNYQVRAEDPDNDELTYSLLKKPSWITISNSGLISGTSPEVSEDINYVVEVNVSDGKDSDTQDFNLTVKDIPDESPGEDTYVLPGPELGQISDVQSDRVIFSQPVNYPVGNIIVAEISNSSPEGFLREVTSVSADKKQFILAKPVWLKH